MKYFLSLTLLFCLTVPLLALSSAPPNQDKSNQPWEVEKSQKLQLIGSFSGEAFMDFMKRGNEKQIRFRMSDAEPGTYDVEVLRGSEKRRLGSLEFPRGASKNMPSSHAEFENLYGGYWERFHVVKRDGQSDDGLGDGLEPPPGETPTSETPPDTDPDF